MNIIDRSNKTFLEVFMNQLSFIGLPRGRGDAEEERVRVRRGRVRRRRQRYLPRKKRSWRLSIIFLFCIGFVAIALVGLDKLASGGAESFLFGKLKGFLGNGDGFGSIGALGTIVSGGREESLGDSESSLPVILPVESEQNGDTTSPANTTTPADTTTQSPSETTTPPDTEQTTCSPLPEGAIRIVDAMIPVSRPAIINETGRKANVEFLSVMQSAVIRPSGNGTPLVLIISTHTSESYLPEGVEYFLPSGELARSEDPAENMIAVGEVLCKTLEEAGIPTLHIKTAHDGEGAGRAYIESAKSIAKALAENPSIRYVIDLHRSAEVDANGNIIRESVRLGDERFARISVDVSGGGECPSESVNLNLALALQLNGVLSDFCADLTLPVRISDSCYNADLSPRTLKIEIGSCASTLQEAKTSAVLLGEALSLLLLS